MAMAAMYCTRIRRYSLVRLICCPVQVSRDSTRSAKLTIILFVHHEAFCWMPAGCSLQIHSNTVVQIGNKNAAYGAVHSHIPDICCGRQRLLCIRKPPAGDADRILQEERAGQKRRTSQESVLPTGLGDFYYNSDHQNRIWHLRPGKHQIVRKVPDDPVYPKSALVQIYPSNGI